MTQPLGLEENLLSLYERVNLFTPPSVYKIRVQLAVGKRV